MSCLRLGTVFFLFAVSCPWADGVSVPPDGANDESISTVPDRGSDSTPGRRKVATPDTVGRPAFRRRYPWSLSANEWPRLAELRDVFEPPAGYERVDIAGGFWGAWLRRLPVRLDRRTVYAHDGTPVDAPAAAVVALPVGEGNLQQCADAILRLRAEYLWQHGRRDAIGFHFTSGDRSAWSDWAAGERFVVDGAEVRRVRRAEKDRSRANFRSYLFHLFQYAGTRSLRHDSRAVGPDERLQPGDFFVDPGAPGHAVVVVDVAVDGDGERVGLIGQGFMPAQEFHVVEPARAASDGTWFELPGPGGRLNTPSWEPFQRGDARRFPGTGGGGDRSRGGDGERTR